MSEHPTKERVSLSAELATAAVADLVAENERLREALRFPEVGASPHPPPRPDQDIETDPNEIAPMALFGLAIKEQEVETLAKAYLDMREALKAVRSSDATNERRVWRFGVQVRHWGGFVVTIEPWSWRAIRRRLAEVCRP